RGSSDFDARSLARLGEAPGFFDATAMMFRRPAMVHLLIGSTIAVFVGYGSLNWLSSFLARSHHMGLVERSVCLAFMVGIGGIAGNVLTGAIADRLGQNDMRWKIWTVVVGGLIAIPFSVSAFLVEDRWTAMILLMPPAVAATIYLGPLWALT